MECDGVTKQTKPVSGGGKEPTFDGEKFEFTKGIETGIKFTILDHELMTSDDLIGKGSIDTSKIE